MKQFITTTHKDTADKFLSSGFCLVSHIDNVYTFLNQPPKNFTFDGIDSKKFIYTNILNI